MISKNKSGIITIFILMIGLGHSPIQNINGQGGNSFSILVDASNGGGAWWFPQSGTFNRSEPHNGASLAAYFNSSGYNVTELGRDVPDITLAQLQSYNLVIAMPSTLYTPSELIAYHDFVSNGGSLLLAVEHHANRGNLASSFGLDFKGINQGNSTVVDFSNHTLTKNITSIPYIAGSGLLSYLPNTVILGWLDNYTYVDLNDNQIHDTGEPYGAPVMGYFRFGSGRVMFIGDTTPFVAVSQPFTDNYLAWFSTAFNETIPSIVIPKSITTTTVVSTQQTLTTQKTTSATTQSLEKSSTNNAPALPFISFIYLNSILVLIVISKKLKNKVIFD